MSTSKPERLRTPPRVRFTGDAKSFDLQRDFERLDQEEHAPIDGHHQITLFKSGTSTVMAFSFADDGYLPEHQAQGVVTMQLLRGRVVVETPDDRHTIGAGGLMVIRPGVPHRVNAIEPAQMIMTVHLQDRDDAETPR